MSSLPPPPTRPQLFSALQQLFHGPLASPDALLLATPGRDGGVLRQGFHSHDSWEIFVPLSTALCFEVYCHDQWQVPAGSILLVAPGCLHMTTKGLPQPEDQTLLTIGLPGRECTYGGIRLFSPAGSYAANLAPRELLAWSQLLDDQPQAIMAKLRDCLENGDWGKQQAVGMLRVLLAAFARVLTQPRQSRQPHGERRVMQAQAYLQTHYIDAGLALEQIAAAVGLSTSHLCSLFRQTTGQTVHRTLCDIRLRRACDLLRHTQHSIKEVAALTGWRNQLYFSSVFRKHQGMPPSQFREQH